MTEYPDSILRVEYRSDKQVAVLTFDAPPLNVITIPTREQFGAVFREIEANDAVRVVIVRGEGEHFSSGGDVVGFSRSLLNISVILRRTSQPQNAVPNQ